jgi:type I restriction enzyme S subunit
MVPLGEVLQQYKEYIDYPEERTYRKLSVKLYGKGVTLDAPADGAALKMKRHQLAKAGQVILSEIWGKKGAIGFVPPEGEGALCTSHFFLFEVRRDQLEPKWLEYVFQANYLQEQLDAEAKGTTGYAAVRPAHLLKAVIPLPPPDEQWRLVGRIEAAAAKIAEAQSITAAIEEQNNNLLMSAYQRITKDAARRRLGDVAPLTRRPAMIELDREYPQISVRSFGKGTFHNPPLLGSEITWEKPHLIKASDILISNIKAWEGAIAVASNKDDGRYGSHRYLTYVPLPHVATARFICFHLLSPEGLHQVGEVSPGSADRNRTLNAKALLEVQVPVPTYDQQLWFGDLYDKADAIKRLQTETTAERDALLRAVLDRAFKGEL